MMKNLIETLLEISTHVRVSKNLDEKLVSVFWEQSNKIRDTELECSYDARTVAALFDICSASHIFLEEITGRKETEEFWYKAEDRIREILNQ